MKYSCDRRRLSSFPADREIKIYYCIIFTSRGPVGVIETICMLLVALACGL